MRDKIKGIKGIDIQPRRKIKELRHEVKRIEITDTKLK